MKRPNTEKIWIAWERHRRTIELSKTFSCSLFIFESKLPRIIKHPILSLRTWKSLHINRPTNLLVQNPSIILTFLALLLRPIYKYKLIVDAHNAGLVPDKNFLTPLRFLYRFIQQKADLTIVTNERLAELVMNNGGDPFILPDRIPEAGPVRKVKLKGKVAILYICTFGDDEPYMEVIKAAKILGKNRCIYITGDYGKRQSIARSAPRNVFFTGYLPEEKYWGMLHSVNLTIDLTLREDCLVCGAYESVATETPMVLSDTKALRKYFYKGTVFSPNNAAALASAINEALEREDLLRKEIKELKKEISIEWEKRVKEIQQFFADGNTANIIT